MPYMLNPQNKKCVHKKTVDGGMGEKVKCHESEEKAKAHLAALYINVEEAGKYARQYVPGYKAITDAPDLRGSNQRHCANCNYYKMMPSSPSYMMDGMAMTEADKGICEKHAFLTEYNWVCDDWEEFVFKEAMKVWTAKAEMMSDSEMQKMMLDEIDEMPKDLCAAMLEDMGEDAEGMSLSDMRSTLKKMMKDDEHEHHENMMKMMGMKLGAGHAGHVGQAGAHRGHESRSGGGGIGTRRGAGTSARAMFDFLNKRLAAGHLKKGERAMLEKRIEKLAKEIFEGGKLSVKVTGDWELDVLGNPYGPDDDEQWFDANSKIVSGPEIPVIYYHSLSEDSRPGRVSFAETPVVIGKATDPTKKSDGTWWRVVLDKFVPEAKKVWEAAKNNLAVASSGAIEYLSRLEINGKLEPYDKSKPGRIAIWHMGELSLWDRPGHLGQAHPHAVAIPALKAIYEAAKMPLPPSLVSPKNAESPANEERKGTLEKLHKITDEIEKFIEINKE